MGIFDGILLMSDLDGTLLDRQKAVSEQNARAIGRFVGRGGLFTLATGRSLPAVEHIAAGLPLNAPAVLANGSCGYDFAWQEPVYEWSIGGQAAALVLAVGQAFPECGVEIHTLRQAYIARDSEHTRRHFGSTKMPLAFADPRDVPPPWVKLCMTPDAAQMPALVGFIERHFPGAFFLQLASRDFLEVQAPNANKGAGALEICRAVGLAAENLYVIGDGSNDVELLRATKNTFAPANACAEVLALSPRMLPSNNEHCIAELVDIIEKERA